MLAAANWGGLYFSIAGAQKSFIIRLEAKLIPTRTKTCIIFVSGFADRLTFSVSLSCNAPKSFVISKCFSENQRRNWNNLAIAWAMLLHLPAQVVLQAIHFSQEYSAAFWSQFRFQQIKKHVVSKNQTSKFTGKKYWSSYHELLKVWTGKSFYSVKPPFGGVIIATLE